MTDKIITEIRALVKREKVIVRELTEVRAKLGSIRMALGISLEQPPEEREDGPYGEAYVRLPEMVRSALSDHGVLDTSRLLLIVNQVRPISRGYLQSCLSKMKTRGELMSVGHGAFMMAAQTDTCVHPVDVAQAESWSPDSETVGDASLLVKPPDA